LSYWLGLGSWRWSDINLMVLICFVGWR